MSATAQMIQLDDRQVIRLKLGVILLGYVTTADEIARVLEGNGLSLADLEIIE